MWRRPAMVVAYAMLGLCLVGSWLANVTQADEAYGRHQFEPEIREHWSFQSVERPTVPLVDDPRRAGNPIDAFVLEGLRAAGLKPAPPSARAKLLRRVYLDLIGLPPTPAELDAFLADTSPTAFEKVVDDLLARPQYGERWSRHWLDVVRYAETNGYERDGLKPQAWRYRDWVIDAFNADMPYDRFLTEQLAGDEIDGSEAQSQIATTMLRLGPWDDEPADALADRYDQLDDIVATTSATFTGLTLRCARCHDHKFEPFSQKDYTRWQAIFAPLKRPQNGRADLDREIGPHEQVAAYHARVKELDARKADIEQQISTLAWQVCQRAMADGRLPTAASAPAAAGGEKQADAAKTAQDFPPDAMQALATEPAKRDDKQKKLLEKHASRIEKLTHELADDDQRSRWNTAHAELTTTKAQYPPALPKGYIWYEEGPTFEASRVFRRGDPRQPGDEILSGFPAVLVDAPWAAATPTPRSTGRRLQLARWLVGPEHPLTARVIVNRLWQHHFGEGIVATENDFGVMGAPPPNQRLLDWLATELVAGGWKLKRMQRLMVLSQTYQMSSAPNAEAEKVDPDGTLLWRFTPQRMEAESLRDTVLAVSGQLNLASRGPSIYPKISRAVLETQSRPGDGWKTSPPAEAARRSVYVFVKRTLLVPELEVLDFPSTEETCEQRVVSTVAPQALTLLNGEFIHEQAQAFARRLASEAPGDVASQVILAYRLALSRLPTDQEFAAVLKFLAQQQTQIAADVPTEAEQAPRKALAALCLVLLNTNEFAYLQ